jgi:PAS domain S-box-containing protein
MVACGMRDQHRPKQELVNEVVALRKQVTDLRDEMAVRRRVEAALRHSEEQLRALVDGSPVGLCLFRLDGTPLAANRPFARLLGYDSPAELLGVGDALGVFINREEQTRVLELIRRGGDRAGDVLFRRKTGGPHTAWVMGAICPAPEAMALVVLKTFNAASSGGTRSA